MTVIIRLQNLPWAANALDIRRFFTNLAIPDGGVHIVGGEKGDAFIAFSNDEDARKAMTLNDCRLMENMVKLLLSSKTEMQNIIAVARGAPTAPEEQYGRQGGPGVMGGGPPVGGPPAQGFPDRDAGGPPHSKGGYGPTPHQEPRDMRPGGSGGTFGRQGEPMPSGGQDRMRGPSGPIDDGRSFGMSSGQIGGSVGSRPLDMPPQDTGRNWDHPSSGSMNRDMPASGDFDRRDAPPSNDFNRGGAPFGRDDGYRRDGPGTGGPVGGMAPDRPMQSGMGMRDAPVQQQFNGDRFGGRDSMGQRDGDRDMGMQQGRVSDIGIRDAPIGQSRMGDLGMRDAPVMQGRVGDRDMGIQQTFVNDRMRDNSTQPSFGNDRMGGGRDGPRQDDLRSSSFGNDRAGGRDSFDMRDSRMGSSGYDSGRPVSPFGRDRMDNVRSSSPYGGNRDRGFSNMGDRPMQGGFEADRFPGSPSKGFSNDGPRPMDEPLRPLDRPMGGRPLDRPMGGRPLDRPMGGRPLDRPMGGRPLDAPMVGRPMDRPPPAGPVFRDEPFRRDDNFRGGPVGREPMRDNRDAGFRRDGPLIPGGPDRMGGPMPGRMSPGREFRGREPMRNGNKDSRKRPRDSDRYVVISGMPNDITFRDVRRFFGRNEIPRDGLKLINDRDGNRVGTAFMKFNTQKDAFEAVKNNNQLMSNANQSAKSKVRVKWCTLDEFDNAVDSYVPNKGMRRGGSPTRPPSPKRSQDSGEAFIAIHKIPKRIEKVDIRKFIGPAMRVARGGSAIYINHTESIAYVEFEANRHAKDALALNKKSLVGEPVEVVSAAKKDFDSFMEKMEKSTDRKSRDRSSDTKDTKEGIVIKREKDDVKRENGDQIEKRFYCIRLHGLPFSATVKTVKEFFSGFSICEKGIHMIYNKRRQAAGVAFVEFVTSTDCERAVAKNKDKIGNRYIEINALSKKDMIEQRKKEFDHHQRGPPDAEGDAFPGPEAMNDRRTMIAMKNLPFKATMEDILGFFRNFRPIADSIRLQYTKDGKPTGEGLLNFPTPQEAHRVCRELQYSRMQGRPVSLNMGDH